MKFGYLRFVKQMDNIGAILEKASRSDDPVEYVYKNDLRTPFFMVEGLCRLYQDLHNGKTFKKMLEQAKLVEDALGMYDFYVVLDKELSADAALPEVIRTQIVRKREAAAQHVNEVLASGDWWNGRRLPEWNKKLRTLKWLKEAEERQALVEVYRSEIRKVYSFIGKAPFPFEDIEEHVHELRRKLRWLSIYCHALDGMVKLKETADPVPEKFRKYLTDKVLTSPFNQFTGSYKYEKLICLDKTGFMALSWMIATIGELKDDGLTLHAIHELAQTVELDKAGRKAVATFLADYDSRNATILELATEYTMHFLADNVLYTLLLP